MSGIPIVLGFDPKAQIHLDTRYQNNGVPYIDTTEVLSVLPLYKRALHLPVDIQGTLYWFDTDTLNHLVPIPGVKVITSEDGSIIVVPIENGFDLSTSEKRTINIGAGLQEGYGLFYNGYTVRKPHINTDGLTVGYAIANSDWAPLQQIHWDNLILKSGGTAHASAKLKQSGNTTWLFRSGQPVDVDSFGFTAVGSGIRDGSTALFRFKNEWNIWWIANPLGSTNNLAQYAITNITDDLGLRNFGITSGFSIRLVKNFTTLTTQGQRGEYIGNDGKHYITILIGAYEYLTSDLAETKWRDGTLIHVESNTDIWVGLTSAAVCAWNNNWSYITSGDKSFIADKNNILSFKGGNGINVSSNIIPATINVPGKVEVVISNTSTVPTGSTPTGSNPIEWIDFTFKDIVDSAGTEYVLDLYVAAPYTILGIAIVVNTGTAEATVSINSNTIIVLTAKVATVNIQYFEATNSNVSALHDKVHISIGNIITATSFTGKLIYQRL